MNKPIKEERESRSDMEMVKKYVAQIEARSSHSHALCKAGIDGDHVLDIMDNIMLSHGIRLASGKSVEAGVFSGNNVETQGGTGTWRKGSGHVAIHTDGTPTIIITNHRGSTGCHVKIPLNLENVARYSTRFTMDMVKDASHGKGQGWLKAEYVSDTQKNSSLSITDIEHQNNLIIAAQKKLRNEDTERQEQRKAQREADEAKRRAKGLETSAFLYESAVKSFEQEKKTNPNASTHGDHIYMKNKFGDHADVPERKEAYKNFMVSTKARQGSTDVEPLLIPLHNLQTGAFVGCQKIEQATEEQQNLNKDTANGKKEYKRVFKEDGSPKLAKKYVHGVSQKGSVMFANDNRPGSHVKSIVVGEGAITTMEVGLHMGMNKPENKRDLLVIAGLDAHNVKETVAIAREMMPKAVIFIAADDDHKKSIGFDKNGNKKRNAGLDNAREASDLYDAIVVSPPRNLLGDKSDWDDAFSNVKQICKNKSNGVTPSFDTLSDVCNSVLRKAITESFELHNKKVNSKVETYQKAAAEVGLVKKAVQKTKQQLKDPKDTVKKLMTAQEALANPAKLLMLACQNDKFKALTSRTLNLLSRKGETKHWESAKPLSIVLDLVDVKDGSYDALEKADKIKVVNSSTKLLSNLITDGKLESSKGISNIKILKGQAKTELWENVDKKFVANLERIIKENAVEGKQDELMAEPKYMSQLVAATAAIASRATAKPIKAEPVKAEPVKLEEDKQIKTSTPPTTRAKPSRK